MNRDDIIATLRAHEPELRAAGVSSLSLIGSTARGGRRSDSDIDILVQLNTEATGMGFAYFGQIDALAHRLEAILEQPVDIIVEPIYKERLRREADTDRTIAF